MSERNPCVEGSEATSTASNEFVQSREGSGPKRVDRDRVLELERRCAHLRAEIRILRDVGGREPAPAKGGAPDGRKAEADLAGVLERVGYGTLRVDASGCVVELDDVAAGIFDTPSNELIGRPLEALFGALPAAIGRGRTSRWEGHTKGGRRYVELGAGSASGTGEVRLIVRDITERHDMERELRRAQRLDAIGRLSAGIAHDMNNVLMAIVGSADRAARRVDHPPFVMDRLEEIRGVAEGGAAVVRRLTAFARDGDRRSVVALDAVVRDVAAMLRPVLGEDVDFAVVLDAGGAYVPCDAGRLEQVLVNLAVNARDAMPGGGRVEVSTQRVREGTVRLEVRDTGSGIEPAVARRLFEPFFTTKADGTGIGLSVVRSIATECGGRVEVGSTPGCGTSVVVELPEVAGLPKRDAFAAEPEIGAKTVLLVEDDPLVRSAARAFLERGGHRVLEASSAEEALAVCGQGPFEAMVTDVVLAGQDGVRLAEEVRARRPAVRVLYVSGYAPHELVRRGRVAKGTFVLPKPYSARELRGALAGLFAPAI